jgi:hypothetical protein
MNKIIALLTVLTLLFACKEANNKQQGKIPEKEIDLKQTVSEDIVVDPVYPFKQGIDSVAPYRVVDTIDLILAVKNNVAINRGVTVMKKYSKDELDILYDIMDEISIEGIDICVNQQKTDGSYPTPCSGNGFTAWPLKSSGSFKQGAIIEIEAKWPLFKGDPGRQLPIIAVVTRNYNKTAVVNVYTGHIAQLFQRSDGNYNLFLDQWKKGPNGEILDENRFGVLHEWSGNMYEPFTVVDMGADFYYVPEVQRDSINDIYLKLMQ